MGGEGTNWIGEAPFSKTPHVFQNLGDGTYIHSGSLAIRAARAAGVNMTFKILYNDAVAMTGGQSLEGGMTVPMIVSQVLAEGIEKVVVVTDEPHKYPSGAIPQGVPVYHRRELQSLQKQLREVPGVSVLVYDQTCAAEKRRRRKRGLFPDPDKRVFINPAVCEGCGDCGVKSNCVAVLPLETELGTKRAIDQSACNKDFSCLNGFCPSFVTVHGAKVKKSRKSVGDSGIASMLASLPEPKLPAPRAALHHARHGRRRHRRGDALGRARPGGAPGRQGLRLHRHDGPRPEGRRGRLPHAGRQDGRPDPRHPRRRGRRRPGARLRSRGDRLQQGARDHQARPHRGGLLQLRDVDGRLHAQPNLKVPGAALRHAIEERAGKAPVHAFDAHTTAVKLFGDSIAANMFILGYAYQLGHVPIGSAAIEQAIELNGAAVEMSRNAFRFGRLAAREPGAIARLIGADTTSAPKPQTLEDIVAFRAEQLAEYQDAALAERYRARVAQMAEIERKLAPGRSGLAEAVARGYYKLLAYKDEYEVARLYASPAFEKALCEQFESRRKLEFHLAPPLLARRDKDTGEPRKMRFGAWMLPVFRLLAKGKRLRGTAFGRVRLFGRAQARAADDRRLREADERDRPAPDAADARQGRRARLGSRSTSRASATSRSATTRRPRRARRPSSTTCATPPRPR